MIIRIVLLLLLIFINGLLSASEIAFLSLDRYDMARKRNKKAKMIMKALDNESTFLSTIQVGITLAGFFASAFAANSFTDRIINKGFMIINNNVTVIVLTLLITLILSYITLVFGELVPKKIARSNPEKVAYNTIYFISIISFIFRPIILVLSGSTNIVCKILNIKERDDSLTEKDIKKMIITGSKEGVVEEKQKEYILNIFEFTDKSAYRIMTPKDKVIYIHIDDSKKEILKKIKQARYTRYPVLNKDDEVLGFINIKDFVYLYQAKKDINIKQLIHPVLKFDRKDKIDDIFRIMQEQHETFSVILENDIFVCILTLEDAIEEIVGNISDEYN